MGSSPTVIPTTALVSALYVGDLHPDVTHDQLTDHFSQHVKPDSVCVCHNHVTGLSLCYGYVNYINSQDAIRAMEKLNNTPLNGKPIRIMWSYRDPVARKSGIGNLFVKNLVDSIDYVRLHAMFAEFGNILSCKIATSQEGKSKGYGFVQFEFQESANLAIEKLNGSNIDGKQIYVGIFIKKSERVLSSPDAKYTNIYIKNLDGDITEELLKLKFSEIGKITNLTIKMDSDGNSKGFGFVNFESPDDAKRATERMNGMQLGSKALYVARAQKKAERQEFLRRLYQEKRDAKIRNNMASNIYVKNIADSVSDSALEEHFSLCGTITSAKIMRDEKGTSKGFGFVCFTTPAEAIKAVTNLHGYMFHGKPLYVAIAQRKEDRQVQLRLQFALRMPGLAGSSTAVFSAGHPSLYYTPGVVPQIPPRQGTMYPPMGLRPGWRPGGFVPPPRPAFQPMPLPLIPNTPRLHLKNWPRMNGHTLPQTGQSMSYMPHVQPNILANSWKDSSNMQAGQANYLPNGQQPEMNNGLMNQSASNSRGTEMLSSMLANASPRQQKEMIGEQLFSLVKKHKPDLAAKVTGMLLEMDNAELLLLLDLPDILAANVEEAVQVLNQSNTKVGDQQSIHPSYLLADVAVN